MTECSGNVVLFTLYGTQSPKGRRAISNRRHETGRDVAGLWLLHGTPHSSGGAFSYRFELFCQEDLTTISGYIANYGNGLPANIVNGVLQQQRLQFTITSGSDSDSAESQKFEVHCDAEVTDEGWVGHTNAMPCCNGCFILIVCVPDHRRWKASTPEI